VEEVHINLVDCETETELVCPNTLAFQVLGNRDDFNHEQVLKHHKHTQHDQERHTDNPDLRECSVLPFFLNSVGTLGRLRSRSKNVRNLG
jgi:hypothetical protein